MTDFAPTRNTYASTQPTWLRDLLKAETHGVLIDGDAMLTAFPSGVVPSGTAISRLTATKRGVPAATASSTAEGHLLNELGVKAGGQYLAAVVHAGTVTERLLPSNADRTSAFKTAMTTIRYI